MSNIYGDDCLINGGGSGGGPGDQTKDPLGVESVDGGYGYYWENTNNVKLDDANYATCSGSDVSSYTDHIVATDFGFSVPAGATILGVKATIKRYRSGFGGDAMDRKLCLKTIPEADLGTEKSVTVVIPDTDTAYDYGSSTDLWGATLTPDVINSTHFGIRYQASFSADPFNTVLVNNIKLTVYWT